MTTLPLRNLDMDNESADLQALLDAFGSKLSLEVIASAYLEANRNAGKAAEILYEKCPHVSDCGLEIASSLSSEGSVGFYHQNSSRSYQNPKNSKQRRCPASMGTVSNVIGKSYINPNPSMKGCCQETDFVRLNEKEIPKKVIWSEENPPSTAMENDIMEKDTEKFLIDMLGDGFQLDRSVIHEVLGLCGYNVEQSMEKLLHLSARSLEKRDNDTVDDGAVKHTETDQPPEPLQKAMPIKRDKYDLQREVLESLFSAPPITKEPLKTRPLRKIRSKAFGAPVIAPLEDTYIEPAFVTVQLDQVPESESEEDDDSFRGLRKAVKEYWGIMKEYYKAAVEAHAAGEHERAYNLMEEGHFYSKRAREADDKSVQKVLETKECKSCETVVLDLKEQDKEEAISLLKFHLTSLSGIPSIEYLKVRFGSTKDRKGGGRKRVIMKLLQRESIEWKEEEDGEVFVVKVSKINPKALSFCEDV